jgi:phosphate starvation-inducible protein PhoH
MAKKQKKLKSKQYNVNNVIVPLTSPSSNKLSKYDLKQIKPLTQAQTDFFTSFFQSSNHIAAVGSAGTGKTYLALYLALQEVLSQNTPFEKVVIIRSAVPSRDIGALPGTEEEKLQVYERPYEQIVGDLFSRATAYEKMKKNQTIEFFSTSYVRGLTLDNCIVIVDECQNLNFHELSSIITRIGENARLILCGDIRQSDLNKSKKDVSGLAQALKIMQHMSSIDIVNFTVHDIVRSGFVKEWIVAVENWGD